MKTAPRSRVRFAVCIKNKGYEASLEIGKLYRVIPDQEAERHGYLRIIDESGEDYGYSANRFFSIDVPKPLERVLPQGRVLTMRRRTLIRPPVVKRKIEFQLTEWKDAVAITTA